MNKTKIEWCDYTWNPVIGCKRNCYYCYARRMNNRFKWIPDFNKPTLLKNRLNDKFPLKPSVIFVGSTTDICYWKFDWINDIINICSKNLKHTFMFLTKFPYGSYETWAFPDNVMLGATITGKNFTNYIRLDGGNDDLDVIPQLINSAPGNIKYISIEPLLAPIGKISKEINLVIVGAMTGPGAVEPKKEWIDSIKHPNVFYKDNIKKYL